jgi:thiol-disulfide isomerase/thioredoxin
MARVWSGLVIVLGVVVSGPGLRAALAQPAATPPAPAGAGSPASPVADPEPSLADLLDRATAERKPLVIELGATWCEPCVAIKQLDGEPALEQARAQVVFARYDLDEPVGATVAARLGVSSVPTELVVDPGGRVVERTTGAPDDRGEQLRWLVEFFDDAALHDRVAAGLPASPAERARAAAIAAGRTLRAAVERAVAVAAPACPRGGGSPTLDLTVTVTAIDRRAARVGQVWAMLARPAVLGCLERALAHVRLPPAPPGRDPSIIVAVTLAAGVQAPAVRRWRTTGRPPTEDRQRARAR